MIRLPHDGDKARVDWFIPDQPPRFDDWPAVYALRCFGDCCEPEIGDGSCVVIDRQASSAAGDFVAIWMLGSSGFTEVMVKRLVFGLAPCALFPSRPGCNGNIDPVLIVEMLNPARCFTLDLSKVYAVHRCIGVAPAQPEVSIGTDVCSAGIRWFARLSRPARARKPQVAGGAHG